MNNRKNKKLVNAIETILQERFEHILEDISFRIGQAYDVAGRGVTQGKVYAEDLNIPNRAFMTGYTVTNNSPVAGSIAWVDLHMVYQGADTTITNANTAKKYVWWSPVTTPTVLQSSDIKPTLVAGEVLLFMNNVGLHKVMLSDTNASLPQILANASVERTAIQPNAVGTTEIEDLSVTSTILGAGAVVAGKIATGGVNLSAQLAQNVVDTNAIKPLAVTGNELNAGAVVAGKIATGGVNLATQFAADVVDTNAIKPLAVTSTELNAAAVTAGKIATGGVNLSAQLAQNVVDTNAIKPLAVTGNELAANAVVAGKIATGAVNSSLQIANGVVGSAQIGTAAVDASRLNIMRHMLY